MPKAEVLMMDELLRVENNVEDLQIQYDVLALDRSQPEIDEALTTLQQKVDDINSEVAKFTNEADWLDNTVAAASGIICGIIDSVFVGEFSFEKANEWGNEKTNNFVVKIAQSQGYTGNDLAGAVKYLEDKFPIAADKATNSFGGGKQHHLRDFSHHPTPVGLFFSILTQFTGKVYGTDTAGIFMVVDLSKDGLALVGKNTPERLTFGVINWFFHMISDIAGSSGSIAMGKVGTGLPGPIGSLLKELSALPVFKKTNEQGYKEFSVWVSKLFNGTLLGERDSNGKIIKAEKFDLRTEIGVLQQLGKQAIPVIINECVVRGFYFIRRFAEEVKTIHSFAELRDINWQRTIPAKNRTIIRMLTISSGTFMAFDMADAAVRGAINSGGTLPGFVAQFVLRINFVGVGRFAIAVGCDVSMGIKKSKLEAQRSSIKTQIIYYKDAKIYYKVGDSMQKANEAEEAIEALSDNIVQIKNFYRNTLVDMDENSKTIIDVTEGFTNNNPDTVKAINDILSEV